MQSPSRCLVAVGHSLRDTRESTGRFYGSLLPPVPTSLDTIQISHFSPVYAAWGHHHDHPTQLPSPGARARGGQRGLVSFWGSKTPPAGKAADGPFTPFCKQRYKTPGLTRLLPFKPHGILGARGAGMEEASAFAPLGIPPWPGIPLW